MPKDPDYQLDLHTLGVDILNAIHKSMKGMTDQEVASTIEGSNLFTIISLLLIQTGEEHQKFKNKFPEKFPKKEDRILKIVKDEPIT